ncbi:hypothetical protein AGR8A_pAt20120 [Agrobacterium fabrum str. J-07]|nr:hypothetical protein AGR8A_pAt20120 [Agrobacterium fabrum str. J-07]
MSEAGSALDLTGIAVRQLGEARQIAYEKFLPAALY